MITVYVSDVPAGLIYHRATPTDDCPRAAAAVRVNPAPVYRGWRVRAECRDVVALPGAAERRDR